VLLKLFQAEGRFPRRAEDVPAAAVETICDFHLLAELPRGSGAGGAWIFHLMTELRTANACTSLGFYS